MPEEKNGRNDLVSRYVPVLVAIVVTFGTTVGANRYLVNEITPELIRPDPFTGTEGKRLETAIETLRTEVVDLRRQVDKLPPRELTERVRIIELQIVQLQRDIAECCKH